MKVGWCRSSASAASMTPILPPIIGMLMGIDVPCEGRNMLSCTLKGSADCIICVKCVVHFYGLVTPRYTDIAAWQLALTSPAWPPHRRAFRHGQTHVREKYQTDIDGPGMAGTKVRAVRRERRLHCAITFVQATKPGHQLGQPQTPKGKGGGGSPTLQWSLCCLLC